MSDVDTIREMVNHYHRESEFARHRDECPGLKDPLRCRCGYEEVLAEGERVVARGMQALARLATPPTAQEAREKEADADIAAGRLTRHESDERFLASLDDHGAPAAQEGVDLEMEAMDLEVRLMADYSMLTDKHFSGEWTVEDQFELERVRSLLDGLEYSSLVSEARRARRWREELEEALNGLREMIGYIPEYARKKWNHQYFIDRAERALREGANG